MSGEEIGERSTGEGVIVGFADDDFAIGLLDGELKVPAGGAWCVGGAWCSVVLDVDDQRTGR